MSKSGRVVFWVLFGFLLLLTAGLGTSLITDGVSGSRALSEGVAGTFTPTDRSCGRSECSWEGTFASDDGTVTEPGVRLRDDEKVRRSTPMPVSIDNVLLVYSGDEPAVYTSDYSSGGSIVAGVVIVVVGLAVAVILIVVKRRHDAKFGVVCRRPPGIRERRRTTARYVSVLGRPGAVDVVGDLRRVDPRVVAGQEPALGHQLRRLRVLDEPGERQVGLVVAGSGVGDVHPRGTRPWAPDQHRPEPTAQGEQAGRRHESRMAARNAPTLSRFAP